MSYELTRCIVCESADARELAGPEDIRREAELLWEFHMRRLSPHTPPDRLVDRVAFSQPRPWRVVRCGQCGLVYRNPVERSQQVRDIYGGEAPSADALAAMHETQMAQARRQARRLTRALGRAGS